MELETVETERLFLKKLTPESFAYLFENVSEAEICVLLGISTHADFLKEKAKSDGGYRTYDRSVVVFLLISKASNQTIGRAGFHNWYHDHRKAEIGYLIYNEENRRRGYMKEAIAEILDYGFLKMNLNRVEACTSPDNSASINVLRHFGFEKEGHLRQHYIRDEEIQDSFIFSLLKNDYLTK
jgi:[ribosomal protein S5]-alanine N-acetyltransferase